MQEAWGSVRTYREAGRAKMVIFGMEFEET